MSNALKDKAKEAGLVIRDNSTEGALMGASGGGIPLGIEGIDDKDLKIANIVLVQDGTKVFTKKGIKPGQYANTVSEKAVEDTTFIPAYMTKKFAVVKPGVGGAKDEFLFATDDEKDPRLNGKRWRHEGDLKPEVIPTFIIVGLLAGQPFKMNLKKVSGYPAGQKLYTFARDAARTYKLPLWGQKYQLLSREAKNKAGTEYWAADVGLVGPTTNEERSLAANLYQSFKTQPEPAIDAVDGEDTVPF